MRGFEISLYTETFSRFVDRVSVYRWRRWRVPALRAFVSGSAIGRCGAARWSGSNPC